MKHLIKNDTPADGLVQPWQKYGFALYVHWPFCESKCPYCDFNSHVTSQVDHDRWLKAFVLELKRVAKETKGRHLGSIFFGGGTPSLMDATTIGGIIDEAASHWTFSNDIEITLEANPSSVETSRFRSFHSAGINRVSVGIQALNDADLRRLGRRHSVAEAMSAIDIAQAIFSRTSFDLIYARQDQTLSAWERELASALTFAGDHLSLYQLTIEPNTVFGARSAAGKLRGLPVEDLAVDMHLLTQAMCESAGMPAYEVSNHALPHGQSRHNCVYWDCGDYIGIGPGAHGRLTDGNGQRVATHSFAKPSDWLNAAEGSSGAECPRDILTGHDQASELLVMGLRVNTGVDLNRIHALADGFVNPTKLQDLVGSGHLILEGTILKTTDAGRLLLNSVIRSLSD